MVQRITIAPQGPEFSRFVMGYWRLMDWNMSARQLVSFIEEHLDLGVTTVDHADIYGGYQCEAAFGEALKLAPHLRERMEIVSKCGIATTAREENVIGHYITDRDHIIKSAEQSLINLATDHLDLLLIHRPDPLMDADEVADAFKHLHQSGKVRHFGVSNFTPAQFALLQSRLPFTLATNQVEISPVHQPLLLDGTLDQLHENKRAPMYWSKDENAAGMCKGPADMEDFQMKFDSLAEQQENPDSIYNYVKQVIKIRNQNPEIARGETTYLEQYSADPGAVGQYFALTRSYEDSTLLMLGNTSAESVTIDLSGLTVGETAAEDLAVLGLEHYIRAVAQDAVKLRDKLRGWKNRHYR